MKKIYLAVVLGMGVLLLASCSGETPENGAVPAVTEASAAMESGEIPAQGQKVSVRVLQYKTELSEQMNEMAQIYMEEHPDVDLRIESIISSDYDTVLKTRFASGEAPDIFNNQGFNEMRLWLDNLEDLTDEPWVKDMMDFTREGITLDGRIYGMPLYIESYGFLYNKDYFEQAGITEVPVTFTGLTQAVDKLEAAGIPAFSVNGAEWYPNGVFFANVPMAQQDDPAEFIRQLNDGTVSFLENPLYQDWLKLVQLQKKHAVSDPMAVDFSTVVSDFANAKAAMILGTNGYQPMIDEVDPDLNIGLMPMPINDDPKLNDKIYAAASTYWCVNKNSPSKAAAKEFLNWLVTSETGRRYITQDFALIPGLTTLKADEDAVGPLGADTQKYIEAGRIAGWEWSRYPDGASIEFGGAIQKYFAGEMEVSGILESFQESWEELKDN